jgi:arylsulfatase
MATLEFASTSGVGRGGTGVLKVDGQEVATQKMEDTIPFLLQVNESLDIGSDTPTGVNAAGYRLPFPFSGTLNQVTRAFDRPKLTPGEIKKLEEARQAAEKACEWARLATRERVKQV